jgi:hypothetical protein
MSLSSNEPVEKVISERLFLRFNVFNLFWLFGLVFQRGDRLHYIIVSCLDAHHLKLFASLLPSHANPGPHL